MRALRTVVRRLPTGVQRSLKRCLYSYRIHRRTFRSGEPEFAILQHLVSLGDSVIDVGANVGHYTLELSRLVGETGRVIALEPVPETFEMLASNVQVSGFRNITLINAAASDSFRIVGFEVPDSPAGYYLAHVSSQPSAVFSVLAMPLDALKIDARITLVKIDTEGHEAAVVRGMNQILRLHRPTLIVENPSGILSNHLREAGYATRTLSHSPNVIFEQPQCS